MADKELIVQTCSYDGRRALGIPDELCVVEQTPGGLYHAQALDTKQVQRTLKQNERRLDNASQISSESNRRSLAD